MNAKKNILMGYKSIVSKELLHEFKVNFQMFCVDSYFFQFADVQFKFLLFFSHASEASCDINLFTKSDVTFVIFRPLHYLNRFLSRALTNPADEHFS